MKVQKLWVAERRAEEKKLSEVYVVQDLAAAMLNL